MTYAFFRQEGFSLNEETWVRDIKEKREIYGISQQKLALAAGITRPYLSDIETGKAHPSEALQEAITEALERFNPDNPLEMLFDYVRIRFPTTDVKHIVEDVLRLKLPYFIHEDYGFYSSTEHYYLGDIFVRVSPELEKGVLLELKGRGCRQFESYLLAQERSWYEFFMDVLMEDGVMKRLDLAINDKTGILNIPHLTQKCRNEEYFIIEGRSLHFLYHPAKGVDFPEPCVALQWKRQFIVFNFDFFLTLNPKTFPDFLKIHRTGKPCPRVFLKILMVKPCGVQDVDFHFLNLYHVLSLLSFWGVTLPKPLVDFRHEAIRACSITEV